VQFNSLQYALFLPVTVLVYWVLPYRTRFRVAGRSVPVRQLFLVAASYLFYAAFDWRFVLLLWFTTAVDYNVAKGLERVEQPGRRKQLLCVSLAVNLGVLGYFKYAGFFVTQASDVLHEVNLDPGLPVLSILLPAGISFYTFQSIAYVVDVYRRDIYACRAPVDFAAFVAFFPQLVAGPISRARALMPQLAADRPRPDGDRVVSALLLILMGLFKKVVIADSLAPLVTQAFDGQHQGSSVAFVGIVSFAFQIYADFSAYTDLARGSARLLNVELIQNFRQPYFSRSVTEFWRRWHISLSNWLRDYLYIPLGGNRGRPSRTYVNLMITMLLGGLWHGAGWTFVIWGGLHGVYLSVERARHRRRVITDELPRTPRALGRVLWTFALVCFAWVFFRATSVSDALDVLHSLFVFGGATVSGSDWVLFGLLVATMIGIDLVTRLAVHPLEVVRHRPALTGALAGLAVAAVVVFSGGTPVPFIYFQF
jgi:D-alanyl-lipoteichoic acid acyltransferase DltB (MBOAT superfamily)